MSLSLNFLFDYTNPPISILGKLQEMVKEREDRRATVHGVAKNRT